MRRIRYRLGMALIRLGARIAGGDVRRRLTFRRLAGDPPEHINCRCIGATPTGASIARAFRGEGGCKRKGSA